MKATLTVNYTLTFELDVPEHGDFETIMMDQSDRHCGPFWDAIRAADLSDNCEWVSSELTAENGDTLAEAG